MERTPVISYSEFPKWLTHASLADVLVNDRDQEEEYIAKGYVSRQAPNSGENYLVAMATLKLDDAIRTMSKRVEEKINAGLNNLYIRVVDIVQREVKEQSRRSGYRYEEHDIIDPIDDPDEALETETKPSFPVSAPQGYFAIRDEFSRAAHQLTIDAMSAVREIAKSTN